MNAKFANEYTKKDKNGKQKVNYVYVVTGTEQELSDFMETTSAKTVADKDGKDNGVKAGDHLWWANGYEGETIDKLVITKDNRVAVDRSYERKLISIANRMGKAGEAMIGEYIKNKLRTNSNVNEVSKAPVASEGPLDELDLD